MTPEELRVAALEEAAQVCERMVIGGRAWTPDQRVAAEALFAAAKAIRETTFPKCDPSMLLLPIMVAEGEDVWCSCIVCGFPQDGRGVVYSDHVGVQVEYLVKIRGNGTTMWRGLHEKCMARNRAV